MVSRRKQALDHLRSRYPLDCNTLSMMFGAKVLMLQQIKVGYPQLLGQFFVGWPQFRLNCRTGYFTSVKDCWGTHIYVWSPTQWKTLTCLFLKTIIPKYSGVATHQSLIEVKWRAINVISCNYSAQCVVCKVRYHCIFYGPGIRYSDIFGAPGIRYSVIIKLPCALLQTGHLETVHAPVADTVAYLVPQVLDTASSSNCLVRLYWLAI